MLASIPSVEIVNTPVVNDKFADLETPRVIFMAMDGIPDAEKYEQPFKAFGGMYMPHIPSLRGSKYMLYRCQFTQLPAFTPVANWEMMISPEARNHIKRSFTQTAIINGQSVTTTVQGFLESDANALRDGEFKNKRSTHVVFHDRKPGHDVVKATRRNQPHGVGGVVEITALKGASLEEITQAQHFFFPNWAHIKSGIDALPTKVKEMENHIKSRIEAISTSNLTDEQKKTYRLIGADMMRSCNEFQRSALDTIKGDEIIFKQAFEAGDTSVRNSPVSEILLEQTESRRKSDLLSGEASATTSLVQEIREERNANAELQRRQLELEERKLLLEEVKLGIRNPDGTLKTSALGETGLYATREYATPEEITNAVEELATDIRICGQPTANGECKRELKDGETACWQHNK